MTGSAWAHKCTQIGVEQGDPIGWIERSLHRSFYYPEVLEQRSAAMFEQEGLY